MTVLACQDVTRHGINKKVGQVVVGSGTPGPGEGVFGATTWQLNDLTVNGSVDLSAIWARIGATDQLYVKTPTGDQTVTVTTNDGSSGGVTTLTVTEDSANGTISAGQQTGVYELGSLVELCTAA